MGAVFAGDAGVGDATPFLLGLLSPCGMLCKLLVTGWASLGEGVEEVQKGPLRGVHFTQALLETVL